MNCNKCDYLFLKIGLNKDSKIDIICNYKECEKILIKNNNCGRIPKIKKPKACDNFKSIF
jgi:hypothetical protein